MAFNYIKYRRESSKESASSSPSEESSAGDEESEEETQDSPPVTESAGDSSKGEETGPDHICEGCKKLGIEDKPATEEVRMNGREVWLCETCYRERFGG